MTNQRDEIEAIVRQVVLRTLGELPATTNVGATAVPSTSSPRRILIDAETIHQLPPHSQFTLQPQMLITPLARQVALERHITLVEAADAPTAAPQSAQAGIIRSGTGTQVVAIGADHGGYTLKEMLKALLETAEFGYTVLDCGTHSQDAVDYPDYAYAVAQLVAQGKAWRGIMIDGAGIGSCMVANKVPGIRAAMCYDQATAVNSREHNNANLLTLGAGLIGPQLAQQIVRTWLNPDFGGGRHARRVDKIDAVGKRFGK
jgi:ribose 5-phosphate isomerase B